MTARYRHLAQVASLLSLAALLPLVGCGESGAKPGAATPRVTASIPAQQPPTDAAEPAQSNPASDKPAQENNVGPLLTAKAEKPSSVDPAEGEAKPKFDPERINGKYFEGWKTPRLAMLITGRQDGYLEPCGCAGLENQKGGIGRRCDLIQQLTEDKHWPLVCLDVGGLVRRFGKQAELQFGISAESLRLMNYRAVGLGAADLRLSAGEVTVSAVGDDPTKSIFVSANVQLLSSDLVPKFRIVEEGGMKIGITSIFGEEYQKEVNNPDHMFLPAAESIAKVLPQLEGCQHRVLLAQATVEETTKLAEQYPQFDVVVTAAGPDEPPYEIKTIGNSQLVQVGHKGMYAIVLGFFEEGQPPRYQRVALDSRFHAAPEMVELMAKLQGQLRDLGWQGLGVNPKPHPKAGADPLAGKFVGSTACKDCHSEEHDIWSKTGHAHATDSLVNAMPQRQYDAECVSCHTVGWNPQEFFPFVSGFESMEKTPHLVGNGCENCHGPGAAHVAAENGTDSDLQKLTRASVRVTKAEASDHVCLKCHDHDNSPEYKFDEYWAKVAHGKNKDSNSKEGDKKEQLMPPAGPQDSDPFGFAAAAAACVVLVLMLLAAKVSVGVLGVRLQQA